MLTCMQYSVQRLIEGNCQINVSYWNDGDADDSGDDDQEMVTGNDGDGNTMRVVTVVIVT